MTFSNTDKKSKHAFYSVKQKRIETATLLEQDRIETKGSKNKSIKKSKKRPKVIIELKNIITYAIIEFEKTHVRNRISQIAVFYKLNIHHYRKSIRRESMDYVVLGL